VAKGESYGLYENLFFVTFYLFINLKKIFLAKRASISYNYIKKKLFTENKNV